MAFRLDHLGTIVVMEDAEPFRSQVSRCLQTHGYTVVEASTASDGIDCLLKLSRADLAVIDLQLPDVNGYEAASTVRDMFGSDLPVLFITSPEKREMSLVSRSDMLAELPRRVSEMLRHSGTF